jgi:hypothetical protein
LLLLALGVLRMAGCGGGSGPEAEPCEYASDCDDEDACTLNLCSRETKTCYHTPIDCRNTVPYPWDEDCAAFELDVCDPEAPEREVCGAVTYINEGRSCGGGGSCLYPDYGDCVYFCLPSLRVGSFRCGEGFCSCQ